MSILNLKTSLSELSPLDDGISKARYEQVPPAREVSGASFSNGQISYKFQCPGNKWWQPKKSYIRIRCRLSRAGGLLPLRVDDNIAPAMNMASNLFQSLEFRIGDKTVSRVSDYVAQCDTLINRLTKSGVYLNTIGNATNFWNSDYNIRQVDVCRDTYNEPKVRSESNRVTLGYDPVTTLALANTSVLTFAGGAAVDNTTVWEIGDYIEITVGGAVGTIKAYVSHVTANTLTLNNSTEVVIAAAVFPFTRIREQYTSIDNARNVMDFELIWQPKALSIFNIEHALPCGNYELILNPQTSSVYKKAIIESLGADKTPGVDFDFSVTDMYLYNYTMEGKRVENLTYLLDLENIRCQSDKIDTLNFSQKNFDVSPSTHGLIVAYQDQRITNTEILNSKFKSYNAAIDDTQESKLNRFFLNYAGNNYPSPDADYKEDAFSDYAVELYIQGQIANGSFYDNASGESIQEFKDRGRYIYNPIHRDGSDRSTRVQINNSFAAGTDVANMRVLLFDLSKQICSVRIQDSRVVDIVLEDA